MEYKLKPITISGKKGEALKADELLVELKDRKVEKRGEVIYLSLSDLIENIKHNTKTRKEVQAKYDYEKARKENIEHFHPEVKEMNQEQLHTIKMYKESSDWLEVCQKQLDALDNQTKLDYEEIKEIKTQVPELADVVLEVVESPYV